MRIRHTTIVSAWLSAAIVPIILGLETTFESLESCSRDPDELNCIRATEGQPSIVVRRTEGRLGNIMSTYAFLLALKLRLNVRVFAMRDNLNRLELFLQT